MPTTVPLTTPHPVNNRKDTAMQKHPHGHYSERSLLWLATNWPSYLFWTATSAPQTFLPLQNPIQLCYPLLYERSLTLYKEYSPSGTTSQMHNCYLPDIIDAYAPNFTLHTLELARLHYEKTILNVPDPTEFPSLAQVHEMTFRSIAHAVCWTDVFAQLNVELAATAESIVAEFATVLPPYLCGVFFQFRKHQPTPACHLTIGPLELPIQISSAPTASPTEMGTIILGLPCPQELELHDFNWSTLQAVLLRLQQELELKGIRTLLPF